jgi:hypothetical protein
MDGHGISLPFYFKPEFRILVIQKSPEMQPIVHLLYRARWLPRTIPGALAAAKSFLGSPPCCSLLRFLKAPVLARLATGRGGCAAAGVCLRVRLVMLRHPWANGRRIFWHNPNVVEAGQSALLKGAGVLMRNLS